MFGALGIIKRGLDYTVCHGAQKIILMSTAHSIRKVLE